MVALEFSKKHELSQEGGERQCIIPEGSQKFWKGVREWSKILLKIFVWNSDILFTYHESGDSKAHYNSALVDRFWKATGKKNCIGSLLELLYFVTFL